MKTIIITWAFIYCALTGPDILSKWDITGDQVFDLRDVAEFQNDYDGTAAVIDLPKEMERAK